MAVGGDSCMYLLFDNLHFEVVCNAIFQFFRYGSMINVVNIAVCLIGAAAFAKASAVILGIVVVCLAVVIISFLAQPVLEVCHTLLLVSGLLMFYRYRF